MSSRTSMAVTWPAPRWRIRHHPGQRAGRGAGGGVGDAVTVVSPQITIAPTGLLPRLRRFTVLATFEVGMYEYDRGVALVHMQDAAKLFQIDDAVSGLRLKLDDVFDAPLSHASWPLRCRATTA